MSLSTVTSRVILNEDLTDEVGVFVERKHAGAVLADIVVELTSSDAMVLGIAAGGLPVAALERSGVGRVIVAVPTASQNAVKGAGLRAWKSHGLERRKSTVG